MNIIEKLMLKHRDAISQRQKELNQAKIRVSELIKRITNRPVKTSIPHLPVIETVRSEQPEVVFSSS
ncbi:hypothetical protein [Psychromonas aquimarina]|uniref:hypothetical protein n=1 Tax=Psychromonas aquimarina TaxID=444919 RepID=UPI00048F3129|nr:hypothetical protein [Psychromonas aquimarina]